MCGGGRRRRFHAVQRPDDRPARARTPPPRPAPRAQPAGRGPGKSRIKSPVSTPQALVQGSSSHRADTVTAAPARLHARRASAAARRRRRHQTPRLGTHNTQSQSSLTVNTPFERHPIPRTHATKHLFSATRHITPRARPHDYSDLPTTRPDSTDALPTRMPGGWKGAWTTTSWHEARSSSRAALERAARRRSGVSRWHALSTLY